MLPSSGRFAKLKKALIHQKGDYNPSGLSAIGRDKIELVQASKKPKPSK